MFTTQLRFVHLATVLSVAGVFVSVGCSKFESKSNPTEPSAVVGVPANLQLEAIDIRARSARMGWSPVPGATSYAVEVGTSGGSSDVGVITTGNPSTTAQLLELPPGRDIFVRIRALQGSGRSEPSAELRFFLQDYKHLSEALLVQTGPYWPGGVTLDGVRGWPEGTHVVIKVSNTLTADQRRGVDGILAQLPQTGVPITATVETMDSNQAFVRRNEIHVITSAACGPTASCVSFYDTSLQQGAAQLFGYTAVFINPPHGGEIVAHEIGHALLGLWHVNYQNVPGAPQFPNGRPEWPFITMYSSIQLGSGLARLSDVEMQIIQDAYRSGIRAGSVRADLRARGLIY